MLEVRRGAFNTRCEVFWAGQQMGVIDLSAWTARGTFYASDGMWVFRKQGAFDQTLLAEQPEGNVVGWAAPATFWGSRWTISTLYGQLVMRRRAFAGIEVESNNVQIGHVAVRGFVNSYFTVHVPSDVHLWVQVFIGWVALLWQQSAAAAAAT